MDEPLFLNNWIFKYSSSEEDENGDAAIYALGDVYNHMSHVDGTRFKTGPIIKIFDNKIITESGNTFYLMTPSKEYLKFIATIKGKNKVVDETMKALKN